MKKSAEKKLQKLLTLLRDWQEDIEIMRDEWQESYDSKSEHWQESEAGEQALTELSHLEDVDNGLQEAIIDLEQLVETED